MFTKIALCLTLSTFFSHAAEQYNYNLPTPNAENNIDLFDDIINQWNPPTPAQADNRSNQLSMQSQLKVSASIPTKEKNIQTSIIQLSNDDPSRQIMLEGYKFNTSLSEKENRKILADLIKQRRNTKKYRCCLADSSFPMDWKEFTNHVRKNHSEEKKVSCPRCNTVCSTHQAGYEHIAWHDHQDMFACPRHCPNDIYTRDSQKALEMHFAKCLHKTYMINQPNENENVVNVPRSFATFCLQPSEDNQVPARYTFTEPIAEINEKVKALHTMQKDNLVQCFTTWFGIVNYIKSTQADTKFQCPICSKKYVHVAKAAGCYLKHWDENAFACKNCNEVSNNLDKYKRHREHCEHSSQPTVVNNQNASSLPNNDTHFEYEKKRIDSALQKINCCGVSLHNWAVAQNHIKERHKAGRNYFCPACAARHSTNVNALECFMMYKDEAVFSCQACKLDCQTRQKLLAHSTSECTSSEEFSKCLASLPVVDEALSQRDEFSKESKTIANAVSRYATSYQYNNNYAHANSIMLVHQPTTEYQTPTTHENSQALDNAYYQLRYDNVYPNTFEQQTPAEQGFDSYDYYMPSSVNNEIVDNSINEYHAYYQNL